MDIQLLVSVWPTVDKLSENYEFMLENGMLIRQDRGLRVSMDFQGETVHADFTNPATREFVWKTAKKNYYDHGVRMFWLDEAEPEYNVYDFDVYRYHSGSVLSTGNAYPVEYAKTFYEGMTRDGQQQEVCNLIRCAWAGSQKFGTLLWSGDVASSWESFRDQFAAGLNVGIAGLPWWTTDIGRLFARLLSRVETNLGQVVSMADIQNILTSVSSVRDGFNMVRLVPYYCPLCRGLHRSLRRPPSD